ncbi:MAG: peptide chain release factor N(5)-glutamine methyltransferase [Anaerolineales bacterium]
MADNTTCSIQEALIWATERLATAGCETPRLDAEILLCECAGMERAFLLAHGSEAVPADAWTQFQAWIARRERREPVAYITGHREFYGLDFVVTPAVLVPRPETEHLVDEVLALARARYRANQTLLIADVGTGSGAIAIALAAHLPHAQVCALDASREALEVAWRNADRHGVLGRMCLVQSDLLEHLPWAVDILVANLPYVADEEWPALAPEIRFHEPVHALRGGANGLDLIRRLLGQAPAHLRPGGAVVLEIGAGQAAGVRRAAQAAFPDAHIRVAQDYAGLDRVVVVQTPWA